MSVKSKLSILFFLQFLIWGSWMVTLGSYLLNSLEFTGQQVGLIYGSSAIAATISPFIMGILADKRFDTGRLLMFLYAGSGVSMIITIQCQTFEWFYPSFIVYTLLFIPTFSLCNSLSFKQVKNVERDFPKIRVWGTLSWVLVGWLISGLVWEEMVYPLYITAGSSLLTAVYCLWLPSTPPVRSQGKSHWTKKLGGEIWPYFNRRSVIVLLLCLILIRIPSSFYYSFVNPYMLDIGMLFPTAKMTIGQISEIGLMLAMPWIFQKMNTKWIVGIGFFLWGFRYLLFDWGAEDSLRWMIYVAIFIHGFTFNFANLAAQIYLDKMVPDHLRSTAQGLVVLITMGIGIWVGSYFAGYVVDSHTVDGFRIWDQIWDYPAYFGLIVALLFFLLFPRKSGEEIRKTQ